MKKKLLALALILAFVASCFTGCFVVKDQERDLKQVVASVKTADRTDEITKRELITYFNSYGYTYMQRYSWTAEKTLDFLLEQLVNRKIVLQNAETVLPVKNEGEIIGHHLEKYLTENQINTIKKKVNESVNTTIEGYLKKNTTDDDDEDDDKEETRTTPTYDEEDSEEIVKAADVPVVDKDSTKARKNAYTQFEKALKKNYYTYDAYYEMLVVSELEDKVMNLWQDAVKGKVTVSMDELTTRYNEMLETQKESYNTPSSYKTALEGVSSSKFVLYNQAVGYGYVYNLLVPFSDYQSAVLSKYTSKYQAGKMTTAEYEKIRATLLSNVVAKDLRQTWISADYDYDFDTKLFGEKYCKTAGIPFDGDVTYTYTDADGKEVVLTNQKPDKDLKGKYSFVLNETPMADFMTKLNTLMKADAKSVEGYTYAGALDLSKTTLAEAKTSFMDMTFAYGSDTGILNSYKGYVSSPKPADNASEKYVTEFANAARDVVAMGAGNYVVVGTDYGWHIIYCTEQINVSETETLVAADMDVYGTFTYRFKTAILDSLKSSTVTEKQTALINQQKKDHADGIKTYKTRYQDLLG